MEATSLKDFVQFDEQGAAKFTGIKAVTLNKWRTRKKGPPFYRLEGKVKYSRADLVAWIESCRVVPQDKKRSRALMAQKLLTAAR